MDKPTPCNRRSKSTNNGSSDAIRTRRWATRRDKLHLAVFTARVIAVGDEQEQGYLERPALHQIPILASDEQQLPSGPGEDPPSQPSIDGLEPDLPSVQAQLEARGQKRLEI